MPTRILYAGATELYFRGLKSTLTEYSFIGFTTDLESTKVSVGSLKPDILLISALKDGWKTPDLLDYRNEHFPSIKVVVITMHTGKQAIKEAFKKRVDGYIHMNDTKETIRECFKIVLQGGKHIMQPIQHLPKKGIMILRS
jgi:two-component system, NarL family, nitrate/nitrite response regulator NarL